MDTLREEEGVPFEVVVGVEEEEEEEEEEEDEVEVEERVTGAAVDGSTGSSLTRIADASDASMRSP